VAGRRKFQVGAENCERKQLQTNGAATAKLREPKHVRTRGTNNNLELDEQKAYSNWNVELRSDKCNIICRQFVRKTMMCQSHMWDVCLQKSPAWLTGSAIDSAVSKKVFYLQATCRMTLTASRVCKVMRGYMNG